MDTKWQGQDSIHGLSASSALCCSFSLGGSNGNLCSRSVVRELVPSAFHRHVYKSVKSAPSQPSSFAHVHPFPFQQIWWVMLLQTLTPPPKPPTLKFLPPPLSYSLFLTLPPEYHCFLEKTLVKQTKDSLRDQESEQFLRLGQC